MELQIAELLFADRPKLDFGAIKSRTETILGNAVDSSDSEESQSSYLIFHTGQMVKYADGEIPAQTALLFPDKPFDARDYVEELQQSWNTPNATELVEGSRNSLLVTELMARALEPSNRLDIFHGVLQAVVEITMPQAIVFKQSQQIIDPSIYLSSLHESPIFRPGALNVRFFTVDGSDGDRIMDTRGLNEIGLPDLQCHFRGLAPKEIANFLLNTAIYLFENGPVIQSGNTIEGITEGSKWVCQFEKALAPPHREILDINPGKPYAAGNR